MQIYFIAASLLIFAKGANISGGHCIYTRPIYTHMNIQYSFLYVIYILFLYNSLFIFLTYS